VKETDPTTSGHFKQVKFVMFASNCVPTVSIGNPNITTVADSGQITLFVWLKIELLIPNVIVLLASILILIFI